MGNFSQFPSPWRSDSSWESFFLCDRLPRFGNIRRVLNLHGWTEVSDPTHDFTLLYAWNQPHLTWTKIVENLGPHQVHKISQFPYPTKCWLSGKWHKMSNRAPKITPRRMLAGFKKANTSICLEVSLGVVITDVLWTVPGLSFATVFRWVGAN